MTIVLGLGITLSLALRFRSAEFGVLGLMGFLGRWHILVTRRRNSVGGKFSDTAAIGRGRWHRNLIANL